VKLADGTGISMQATVANQARYPQPRGLVPAVGFPLAGLVGLGWLSTGAVFKAAIGAHASKSQSEQDLFRSPHGAPQKRDVLLANELYSSHFQITRLDAAGVDELFG